MAEPRAIEGYDYVGTVDGPAEICDFIYDNNAIDDFLQKRGADPGTGIAIGISIAALAAGKLVAVVNIVVGGECILVDIIESSSTCNNLVIDVYLAEKRGIGIYTAPVLLSLRCEGGSLPETAEEIADNIKDAGGNIVNTTADIVGDTIEDIDDALSSPLSDFTD